MPNATYQQAVALKALGMPQDVWPQLVWAAWEGNVPVLDYWYEVIEGTDWCAAPNVIDAILWVLGTEAGERIWEQYVGLFVYRDGGCDLRSTSGSWGMDADTPSDLLDKVLAAVKEA